MLSQYWHATPARDCRAGLPKHKWEAVILPGGAFAVSSAASGPMPGSTAAVAEKISDSPEVVSGIAQATGGCGNPPWTSARMVTDAVTRTVRG